MKPKLKRSLLEVVRACDGLPMPETALLIAARLHQRPERPTDSDILNALHELESQRYVIGVTDELTNEVTWSLTAKGTHRASQER